jgi:hypothetical protein
MRGREMSDPEPWRHVSGARVAEPWAPESPSGGYTFDPRPGYADYPDRYVSTSTFKDPNHHYWHKEKS